MELIRKYFPELNQDAGIWQKLEQMQEVYGYWNERINVISRKDMDHFYERHVLHSLSVAHYYKFDAYDRVMDIGTGGGFPGIPLAIVFPETQFVLVDSRKKKCEVSREAAKALDLKNVDVILDRVENLQGEYSYFISRAVAPMVQIADWCRHFKNFTSSRSIYLKGGDLEEEIKEFKAAYHHWEVQEYGLSDLFEEDFFSTKKLLYTKRK